MELIDASVRSYLGLGKRRIEFNLCIKVGLNWTYPLLILRRVTQRTGNEFGRGLWWGRGELDAIRGVDWAASL